MKTLACAIAIAMTLVTAPSLAQWELRKPADLAKDVYPTLGGAVGAENPLASYLDEVNTPAFKARMHTPLPVWKRCDDFTALPHHAGAPKCTFDEWMAYQRVKDELYEEVNPYAKLPLWKRCAGGISSSVGNYGCTEEEASLYRRYEMGEISREALEDI